MLPSGTGPSPHAGESNDADEFVDVMAMVDRDAPGGVHVMRAERPVVLTRPYNGIGDWLFCLAVLKLVNRQRPDVPLYVDFSQAHPPVPRLVPEAFELSDVVYTRGRPGGAARVTRDSLVYRKYPPANYIESTLHHLNDQTGLDVKFEPGVYPDFGIKWEPGGKYVVMIAHGKRRERHRKEWGYANLDALATRLVAAGYRVIQIGGAGDRKLRAASDHYLGRPFIEVAPVLANARAYVGLENGIAVLAGFLGVPELVIYDGHSWPDRLEFERLAKIPERIEVPAAAERVLQWLASC